MIKNGAEFLIGPTLPFSAPTIMSGLSTAPLSLKAGSCSSV